MNKEQKEANPGEMHVNPGNAPSERSEDVHVLLFLSMGLVGVLAVLLIVWKTQAWDPYVCDQQEDCRGLKVCQIYHPVEIPEPFVTINNMGIEPQQPEGYCVSPEVWERISLIERTGRILRTGED